MRNIFFLLLFLNSLQLQAQVMPTSLHSYFSTLAKNDQFNGNVLIAEQGKIIYEKSFGYADFSKKRRNKSNTRFPIASVSKTLTATAILQLVKAGKLDLNSPVQYYLPSFPYPPITAKHLLSHTSGLPPYNAYFDSVRKLQPQKVFTNSDFLSGLAAYKKPLLYQPGERGNYDNINFIVLALLLEQVSGLPYTEYIKKHILQPAGMKQTDFFPLKLQNAPFKNKAFAFPHLYPHLYSDSLIKASQVPYVANYWSAYNFTGFGDYTSTARDLLKFNNAYDNLLTPDMLKQAYTPVRLNSTINNLANFGLGWQIAPDSSFGKIVYHAGAATGLSCILLRNITKDQTIIIFDNIHYNAQEMAFNALKLLNGVQLAPPRKSIARIYARMLVNRGAQAARETLNMLKKDSLGYFISEDEMNSLGYDFLGGENNPNPYRFPEEKKYAEALETFKLNMELFPRSWNVYDSYGEALLKVGRKDEAIRMYKKSIELNPDNEFGKKVLKQLLEH